MSELILARWQFGITSTYHFLFVPLTLGLSILVALMEILYVYSGNELYKKMTKFWGKLFLINFAMGVVTGIVQEFHFGMNWSEYSRFMGDIFGAPLALEALTAFFLESTFIGLWIFGWDKISKGLHAFAMCLVAFATNLSAFWILAANSFMQAPVGYALRNSRAEMVDFSALITNPYVMYQYPHTLLSGLVTAGVFIMAISAYHLLRQSHVDFFKASLRVGVICTLLAGLAVSGSGHLQTQFIAKAQPMKLAAAEALWESANPAPFALIAVSDETKKTNTMELQIPGALSFLAYNSFNGEVKGINDIQSTYEKKYGPGNYIPPVTPVFWSFRVMVLSGMWLLLMAVLSGYLLLKGRPESAPGILKAVLWSLPVPYIANSSGWFVAEMGRQPWIVFGLQRVDQGVSPNVSALSIWISMLGFTVIYGALAIVAVYLAAKFAAQGPVDEPAEPNLEVKGGTTVLWS